MASTDGTDHDLALRKTRANYAPLTPLTFLAWAADVFPARPAVVHESRRFTWRETFVRCRRLASALVRLGTRPGDTIAAMLSNTPEMYECHFGVPMAGAVLNALNTRLDAGSIAFMLAHSEARVVIVDREFSGTVAAALPSLGTAPVVIDVDDPEYRGPGTCIGAMNYEALLASGDPEYAWLPPSDEWHSIAVNYTSGTTGNPKGVVYSHRGAYLNALGEILTWSMPRHAVYLWTLPMFHCNGWCFPWSTAAVAGTNVCLRKVDAATIFRLIREHRITHYCGAPVVHSTLLNAAPELRAGLTHTVHGLVAGASPPAALMAGMERIGFELTHVYGLTEVYGPATVCVSQADWTGADPERRAELNARQGVRYLVEEEVAVLDPETMRPVPQDGETMGEVMFRGNIMMKGYLKNLKATADSFAGGWFHSGDLAVVHPDGYIKIRDRAKDIVISGGENISSLEVEDAICHHPAVMAAAVVALPDPKWGETPCAFVELKPSTTVTEEEIIEHCRSRLAHFKAPRSVIFGPLPRTATGKVQKFVLRERARSASAIS
ncbi:MAG TPA: acyl-CoA synthetase [Vicinamibacterales bacterium]|nr:acyl-CoA synthetase [Vicinamibacterales bacterium]